VNTFDVIKKPIVTEKSSLAQQQHNQYCFRVDMHATKCEVRDAVERIFKVTVRDVRTAKVPGKYKRVGKSTGKTSSWKKAIVTIKEGDRIEFLEGA
jgi:large subunit ribosomal protein L23